MYAIDMSSGSKHRVNIVLLFLPNTRQLADAQISGMPSDADMSDVVGAHVLANDAPGLIAAVLARARFEVQ